MQEQSYPKRLFAEKKLLRISAICLGANSNVKREVTSQQTARYLGPARTNQTAF